MPFEIVGKEGGGSEIRAEKEGVMPATTGLMERVLTNSFASVGSAQRERAASTSRMLVPQTLGDVGFLVATGSLPILRNVAPLVQRRYLASAVRFLAGLPPAIQRIVLGAIGDEAGSRIAGREPWSGAIEGGAAAAIGEAGMGVMKGVARHAPVVGKLVKGMEARGKAKAEAAESARVAGIQAKNQAQQRAYREQRRDYAAAITEQRRQYREQVRDYKEVRKQAEADYQTARSEWVKKKTDATKARMDQQKVAYDQAIAQHEAAINKSLTADLGQKIGEVSPPMGFKTAEEASEKFILRGDVKQNLGKHMEVGLKDASNIIGPETKLKIPTFKEENADKLAIAEQLRLKPRGDSPGQDAIWAQLDKDYPDKDTFTLREFWVKLKDLRGGYAGKQASSTTRTPTGAGLRATRAKALAEAEDQVRSHPGGDEAWQIFSDARRSFSFGTALIDKWHADGIFSRPPGEAPSIDWPALQKTLRTTGQDIKDRLMVPDDWNYVKGIIAPEGKIARTGGKEMFEGIPGRVPPLSVPLVPEPSVGPEPTRAALPRRPVEPPLPGGRPVEPVPLPIARPTDPSYPFSPWEYAQIYIDSGVQRTVGMMSEPAQLEMTMTPQGPAEPVPAAPGGAPDVRSLIEQIQPKPEATP